MYCSYIQLTSNITIVIQNMDFSIHISLMCINVTETTAAPANAIAAHSFFPLNHTFYASLTERRETKKLFCSMELLTKKIALIHKWNRCHARHCSCMMYLREIDDIGFILIHSFSHSFDLAPCICICACIKIFVSFF